MEIGRENGRRGGGGVCCLVQFENQSYDIACVSFHLVLNLVLNSYNYYKVKKKSQRDLVSFLAEIIKLFKSDSACLVHCPLSFSRFSSRT